MTAYPVKTEFVDANGLVFETDQSGDGNRLALFLHGFPEHSFSWRYQLPLFAELGYTAWAPNMRGYGNSSSPHRITENYVNDFTIRYLANVSHWVQQEAPETVNTMIKAWLAGKPVPETDTDGKIKV